MDISGKVVIVTGASAGIGLASARLLAAEGAKVVLAARSAEKLGTIEKDLCCSGAETVAIPTDMRDRSQVERLVNDACRRFGGVDILVNNAGQALAGAVADFAIEDYRKIIELNIIGPIYALQAVVPYMRKRGGGLILNISSMVTRMHLPGLAGYASTKSALNMLSETARLELAHDNIRVILVLPRTTATDFGRNSLGDQELRRHQREAAARSGAASYPIDTPEFVARKILDAIRKEPAEQTMDG
jgi:NAD(P)-dependent dehydrogenase (short-subunit alcohol dehydrogenase family)